MQSTTSDFQGPAANMPLSSTFERHAVLASLTLLTFLVHGYHPLAEDGGLYVAGLEYRLDPSLFPHYTAFVVGQLRYSAFVPVLESVVHLLRLPLEWVLLLANIACIWLTLYAAWRLSAQCFRSQSATGFSVAFVAASFTVPVAGTSLLMMDPYVTARSFSTPLSLLALSFTMQISRRFDEHHRFSFPARQNGRTLGLAALALFAAAACHPLMALYAAGFVAALLIVQLPSRASLLASAVFVSAVLAAAGGVQLLGPSEPPSAVAAAISRYYWFLSQWHWFEVLGLVGPLLVFAFILRFAGPRLTRAGADICRAATSLGTVAVVVALLFAQQHYASHSVARLQPLRAFLLIYVVMILLLGGVIGDMAATWRPTARQSSGPLRLALPALLIFVIAAAMFGVQRLSFPASHHLELPWRAPINPWSQAFVWARTHTPQNTLFALDADYITTPGEDAQTFRATARRSVLPDFSKDGGEAAIRPSLAPAWSIGAQAQKDLSALTDPERDTRLRPLGVAWIVLHSTAVTSHACPYDNGTVKVCRLTP